MFESQCKGKGFGVSDGEKRTHLLGLFTGKYRQTLITIDEDQKYTSIRDTVVLTYNLNTDGYRLNFLRFPQNRMRRFMPSLTV